MQGADGRHKRMVSTQCAGIVPPCTRPTGMAESDLVNGWPQRALSLCDMIDDDDFSPTGSMVNECRTSLNSEQIDNIIIRSVENLKN